MHIQRRGQLGSQLQMAILLQILQAVSFRDRSKASMQIRNMGPGPPRMTEAQQGTLLSQVAGHMPMAAATSCHSMGMAGSRSRASSHARPDQSGRVAMLTPILMMAMCLLGAQALLTACPGSPDQRGGHVGTAMAASGRKTHPIHLAWWAHRLPPPWKCSSSSEPWSGSRFHGSLCSLTAHCRCPPASRIFMEVPD